MNRERFAKEIADTVADLLYRKGHVAAAAEARYIPGPLLVAGMKARRRPQRPRQTYMDLEVKKLLRDLEGLAAAKALTRGATGGIVKT